MTTLAGLTPAAGSLDSRLRGNDSASMAASRLNRDKLRRRYARYTSFPPTIVAVTFPLNFHPSNGELRLFERPSASR